MADRQNRLSLTFRTADDTLLHGVFHRAERAKAAVIIAGGTAIHQRYYSKIANYFSQIGLSALTFDYRGIGASRPLSLRGFKADMCDWAEQDLSGALAKLKSLEPDVPVLAFCHSFGGQALGMSRAMNDLCGAITIGSQMAWYGHWSGMAKHRMWALWRIMMPATVSLVGYVPGWMGLQQDLPGGVALQWSQWALSEGYFLDHLPHAKRTLEELTCPVHIVGFTDDTYAPVPAVQAFAGLFSNGTSEIIEPRQHGKKGIGHFGFFQKGCSDLWPSYADKLQQMAQAS